MSQALRTRPGRSVSRGVMAKRRVISTGGYVDPASVIDRQAARRNDREQRERSRSSRTRATARDVVPEPVDVLAKRAQLRQAWADAEVGQAKKDCRTRLQVYEDRHDLDKTTSIVLQGLTPALAESAPGSLASATGAS